MYTGRVLQVSSIATTTTIHHSQYYSAPLSMLQVSLIGGAAIIHCYCPHCNSSLLPILQAPLMASAAPIPDGHDCGHPLLPTLHISPIANTATIRYCSSHVPSPSQQSYTISSWIGDSLRTYEWAGHCERVYCGRQGSVHGHGLRASEWGRL